MEFRIANTFTSSLTKLSNQEQKAVKTTAFDLQLNPTRSGSHFHRIDKTKDANFWSVRVSRDIRLIVHKTEASLLLCYVDHHDKAYRWAEKRKLEVHPETGAAQLVELQETVEEITAPIYLEKEELVPSKQLIFADMPDDTLLKYGVPSEWIAEVRNADEGTLLDIATHLPEEAAEALLELATSGRIERKLPDAEEIDPFDHPDAQRRFRLVENREELKRALDYPWENWTVFLHPMQRKLVEQDFSGPVRISGSAGTGKTIVALHRAVFLARKYPDSRVLLTTFSDTLANSLKTKLRRLIGNEPRIGERLEVYSLNEVGRRLYQQNRVDFQLLTKELLKKLLEKTASEIEGHRFSQKFLLGEWEQVVDAWQLESWEDYRDVLRLGRKTRLPEKKREVLWSIFSNIQNTLKSKDIFTYAKMFNLLANQLKERRHPPFDFVVVDEVQDISIPQLKFLAVLGGERSNSLFFTGDLGQRIFQQPFSWKSVGVDLRGRSHTLRINYRTSHQIRMQADRLLGPEISDVDGIKEERTGTISVFNGPKPTINILKTQEEESQSVGKWILGLISSSLKPHEIGVFVRSDSELNRARETINHINQPYKVLDESVVTSIGQISISTMHLAKGLEFRAVAVMACDDEVIPSQQRIETVADDADLEEVYNTERHLLYVACTRARDHLLVTGTEPASEFLEDLSG